MNYDKFIALAQKQEELLQFPSFSRQDVWDLGSLMASMALEKKLGLSISIRSISGLVLFQYFPPGTNLNHESWMTRKYNVVRDLEISSLLNYLRLLKGKHVLQDQGLDPKFYAPSGGAFPIKLKDSGLVAVVADSGLHQLEDHDFLVESISRFLHIADVPRIPLKLKL
ncbi:heme-degrading domain-containing protein [Leadbettera azotonutricia]|uniref:Uncharacterized protein n=1 Tax=Leadbettera azotonutricia (strain ATCC BAA-888 / DSM 13862 / ZAS-9) TaxID=545695 RepID=F5YB77_LEAAZ|nr:heme-binding protein [Leadbettera azotonutricia]AEF80754.1 conserved hypothetical protein [Leadbettera azotonutricia ZAS-9]